MNHEPQPKSRLAAVTFAQELHCLNRGGSMLNITSKWQDPKNVIFCNKCILQKSLTLKSLVPKFPPDLYVRLKDITEKQVPAKLKPIVEAFNSPWLIAVYV